VLPKNSSNYPFDYDSTNSRTALLLLLSEKSLKKIFLMILVTHTTFHNFLSSPTFTYVLFYIQPLQLYINVRRVVRGRAGRPARTRTQHDYHHDTKVKPEAATAVIELLMMGGKTPETC
jgi:hypothetical protein